MTTFECTEWLEDNRYEATPLFGFPPEAYPQGIAVRPDAPAPNVYPNFAHVAVACGLGEIGINGELLTPEFGPRQRIQLILTDAPLDPDPIFEGTICQRCMACAKSCPLGAVDTTALDEIIIAGKTMSVAKIDYSKCAVCKNGAGGNIYNAAGHADRLGAICNRSCVDCLDTKDVLTNKFVNPFRIRKPWGIDSSGQIVQPPVEPGCNISGEEA